MSEAEEEPEVTQTEGALHVGPAPPASALLALALQSLPKVSGRF